MLLIHSPSYTMMEFSFRPLSVDCGQGNVGIDLENMNFFQIQEPTETLAGELMIVGMISVLDRDCVSL